MITEYHESELIDQEARVREPLRYFFVCDDKKPQRRLWNIDRNVLQSKNFDISFGSVLKEAEQLSLFVDSDPEILGGTPRVRDTRIPIYRILNAVEEYGGLEQATTVFRSLTLEMVKDAVRFAANVLESPVEHDDPNTD